MSGNRSPTAAYKPLPTEERAREEKEEAEIRKALATGNGKDNANLHSGLSLIAFRRLFAKGVTFSTS